MKNMRIEMRGSVAKDAQVEEAKAYSKPELKQFGSVVGLTRSGLVSGNEHASGAANGSCNNGGNQSFRSCL